MFNFSQALKNMVKFFTFDHIQIYVVYFCLISESFKYLIVRFFHLHVSANNEIRIMKWKDWGLHSFLFFKKVRYNFSVYYSLFLMIISTSFTSKFPPFNTMISFNFEREDR